MLRLRPILKKLNCVICQIVFFSQSQFAIIAIHFTTLMVTDKIDRNRTFYFFKFKIVLGIKMIVQLLGIIKNGIAKETI